MRNVQITAGEITVGATFNDSPTADALWEALPLEARASTWGDEIYFGIPVLLDEAEDALEVVELGDLGYWSPGHAFCIFFGPTPDEPGQRDSPGQRGQRLWLRRGRPHCSDTGGQRRDGAHRARLSAPRVST